MIYSQTLTERRLTEFEMTTVKGAQDSKQYAGTINIRLLGRLGNQFFEYATVRGLQEKFYKNYKIVINTRLYDRVSEDQKRSDGQENVLQYFNVKDVEYISKRLRYTRTWFQNVICRSYYYINRFMDKRLMRKSQAFVNKMLQPIFNIFGIYNPFNVDVPHKKPLFSLTRNIFYDCMSWNYRDFDDIRDALLEEFTPIYDVLPHNEAFLKDIQESESVCVHIRRGDYLSIANLNVCKEEYFVTAMKAIREELPNCKFFVFSDDVEDVKKNMHFPFDVTYERGDDPVWEKLRLMYSCKHFIISNSTFSWWAQYLSRNPDKIVYAPIPWVWSQPKGSTNYPPNARLIQCYK